MSNSIQLPSELVIEVMSHLSNVDDIKNCLLISKEIRDMIFKTPKIMRKIHYNFKRISHETFKHVRNRGCSNYHIVFHNDGNLLEAFEFVAKRGSSIRNVAVPNFSLIDAFLHQLPNVEDLRICQKESKMRDQKMYDEVQELYGREDDDPIEMKRLKNLVSECSLDNFVDMKMKNVTNLEKLVYYPTDDCDPPMNLICKQNNLKELILKFPLFPTRDISADVKFKLKNFEIKMKSTDDEHLVKFLETQADSLEEFSYILNLSFELCKLIFEKFKKLKILRIMSINRYNINPVAGHPIYDENFSNWKLETVKEFYEKSDAFVVDLKVVYSKFPNLELLQCAMIKIDDVNLEKLKVLDIFHFMCESLKNAKFPNLKKLMIDKIIKPECFGDWKCFVDNFPSIEIFSIRYIEADDAKCLTTILKILKDLKNLKSFHMVAYFTPIYDDDLGPSSSSKVARNWRYRHVRIDTDEKLVTATDDIVNSVDADCKEIHDCLKENFEGFEIYDPDTPKAQKRTIDD